MRLQESHRLVIFRQTHPGNIGAAARAMNNMCFSDLALLDPQCPVGEVAYARASGANAILDNRDTASELSPLIKDCQLVVAASARRRCGARPLQSRVRPQPSQNVTSRAGFRFAGLSTAPCM